jgi:phosphomannomutase
MEKAGETFRKFKIQEERMLDGFKLVFADGSWVMFRSSGTEPKTRLYCESKDLQQLDVLVQLGTQCIESSK